MDLITEQFGQFDKYNPIRLGFVAAIDKAVGVADQLQEQLFPAMVKVATEAGDPNLFRSVGTLAQLWRAPELKGIPQKPSTLASAVILGSLGALGGYGLGRLADAVIPGDAFTLGRMGALVGGLAGVAPAAVGGALNAAGGRPVLTTSFWDWEDKQAKVAGLIDVEQFNDDIWNNPGLAERLPPTIQAAASGLVTSAANLPGKTLSGYVTPFDVTRAAIGMGAGAASGAIVGQLLTTAFGTDPWVRDKLISTGAMAGLIKTVVPMVFGG